MAAAPGAPGEFRELVERHRRQILHHCYRMLGSWTEAADGDPAGPAFVVDEGTPYALLIVPVVPSRPGTEAPPHQH
jgi:hypothetical protein